MNSQDADAGCCKKTVFNDLVEEGEEEAQYSTLTQTYTPDDQTAPLLDVAVPSSPIPLNFDEENNNSQKTGKGNGKEEKNDKNWRMKCKKRSSNLRINPLIFEEKIKMVRTLQGSEGELTLTPIPKNSESVKIEFFKFSVQTALKLSSNRGPRILEIQCEPITQPSSESSEILNRDSVSSGNLADVSQTHSTTSESPNAQIQLPPSWATRASQMSTSSSGSSMLTSASALAFQQRLKLKTAPQTRCLSIERIEELRHKWCKTDMIYHILDYIDRCVYGDPNSKDEQKLNNVDKRNVSSKKRPFIDEDPKYRKKRIRAFHLDPSMCSTVIGKEVFAKCEDGNYYYGIVTGVTKTGQLDVDFSDVKHLCVNLEDTITSVSSLVCHSVMVAEGSHRSIYPAIVSEYFTNSFPCKFGVISDYGDTCVGGGQIFLTEVQANAIQESSISTTNNDIAISGPSGVSSGSSGTKPTPNGVTPDAYDSKPGPSGMKRFYLSSSDSEGPSKHVTDMNIYKYVVGCDMEASNAGVLNSLLKLKGIAGKIPKRCNKREDRILGPLTVSGSWFKGLNFILTCSIQNLLAPDSSEDESSETNNTDSEDYIFSKVPYVSDRLAQQIRLGGGRVLTTFEELDMASYSETYLITNRPCVTARFLKCLALGVTIACHEWIINCTLKQKRLMVQELPAGWSLEHGIFITMYRRKAPRPFAGMRIQFAQYSDPNFIRFWGEMCRCMGSTISILSRLDKRTNIVVAEDGYHGALLDEAIAQGIPIVSAAWIAQSLIHGQACSYRAHHTFDHLYEETWEY